MVREKKEKGSGSLNCYSLLIELSKKETHGIYLFFGEEGGYLKKEAIRIAVSSNVDLNAIAFDFQKLDGSDNIKDFFTTPPLGGKKKFFVIENAHNLSKEDIKFLTKYEDDKNLLIFLISDESLPSPLFKGTKVNFVKDYTVSKKDLYSWVMKLLDKKPIKTRAADLLLEMCQNDLYMIRNEIQKLLLYTKDKETIDEEDVLKVVSKSKTKNIFDFIEAVSLKNKDKAHKILEELLEKEEDPLFIIAMLQKNFLNLLLLKEAVIFGIKSQEKIQEYLKLSTSGISRLQKFLKNYSSSELEKVLFSLEELEYKIKSGKLREKTGIFTILNYI